MPNTAIITAAEVAEMLGVNIQTVYRLSRRGEIPSFKIGTLTRFSRARIDAWINGES